MIEQVHGVEAMSSYKFIEKEIVTPLSNDMFITGADLAAMLHKLEKSSELERFSKGSQVGFTGMYGLTDVTTLEDTSQLESDWRAAWNAGLARLKLIPAGQRSNGGNWSLDVDGVFVEEAAPPGISWNTSQLDMDEVIGEASSNNNIPYFMNPWLYLDEREGDGAKTIQWRNSCGAFLRRNAWQSFPSFIHLSYARYPSLQRFRLERVLQFLFQTKFCTNT